MFKGLKFYWILAWTFISIVYVAGLFLDIMDIDAAQYAAISKEMFFNHSYLEVYLRGTDYLDKPPFLFWSAVFLFNIFGVHDWVFRLPSLLVTILGVYSTFRFTRIYYPLSTARLAALITAGCQAFFLMNHDVKTDALLTGFVMFSFWQMAEFDSNRKIKHIILAGVGIGLAMLSKGPIALVVPGTAFFFHYLLNRDWKKFIRWQYLLAILVIAIILLPMSYGLYTQFDLHPEKVVYELQGPSGLRFFYWTQSFGRITGEIYWDNNPDTFFLVNNFIWSFLPWCLLFFVAFFVSLIDKVKALIKGEKNVEWISTAGFLLIFIFLSLSRYQLPHYTFVIHPLAAIILASFTEVRIVNNKFLKKTLSVLMGITITGLLFAGVFMFGVYFKAYYLISFGIVLLGIIISTLVLLNRTFPYSTRLILTGVFIISSINIVLNAITYPQMFKYQSGSEISKYVNENSKDPDRQSIIYFQQQYLYSADYYARGKVKLLNEKEELIKELIPGQTWIVSDSTHLNELETFLKIKHQKVFYSFPVSRLNGRFLNPKTRIKETLPLYLIRY